MPGGDNWTIENIETTVSSPIEIQVDANNDILGKSTLFNLLHIAYTLFASI